MTICISEREWAYQPPVVPSISPFYPTCLAIEILLFSCSAVIFQRVSHASVNYFRSLRALAIYRLNLHYLYLYREPGSTCLHHLFFLCTKFVPCYLLMGTYIQYILCYIIKWTNYFNSKKGLSDDSLSNDLYSFGYLRRIEYTNLSE